MRIYLIRHGETIYNTAVTCIDGPPCKVCRPACTAHLPPDQVTYPGHPAIR